MKLLLTISLLAVGWLGARADGHGKNCTSYPCLIFEDNFDTLDFDKWQHEITAGGGGNWEFQYYRNSRRNSFVQNGHLHIRPTITEEEMGENYVRTGTLDLWGASPANLCTGNAWGGCFRTAGGGRILNPAQSARLRSVNSFNYRYGRVEVRAKMPMGDWLWPAIWMLPKSNEYGEWPASGEIDIVEVRSNRQLYHPDANGNPGKHAGIQEMGMTMHWGPKWPQNAYNLTHGSKSRNASYHFGSHFHKYRIDWSHDEGLKFYLDDEHVFTSNPPEGYWKHGEAQFYDHDTGKPLDPKIWNPWIPERGATRLAPFDKPFHIIMNVAVGGTNGYIHDSLINLPYPKPWKNDSPNAAGDFYAAKHLWYPTWNDASDENARAMKVDYVRVWKLKPDP